MRAYIDTSVLLRIVFGEAGALREWRSIDVAISSELIRLEALRSVDRARIRLKLDDDEVAERRSAIFELLSGFHIARLDAPLLERAAEPFPTLLGTLDALHLATAMRVRARDESLVFATHDGGLATAARATGFRVVGVPAIK